jgi:putative hydrolase of the HAD superfamily
MNRPDTTDPAMVEAILLDALGTLVGIEPPWGPLIELLATRHGAVVGEEAVMRALRAEMTYYRAHCLEAADAAALDVLRLACAEVIAGELGGPVAAIDRRELSRTLVDSLRFTAYPEAADVLRRLRAGGTRLVVVSNWDVSLHDALDQAGLAALVDGVVCSAVVGVAKPDPAAFHAGLTLAGVPGERALHVGDSYAEDVLGARAAGIEPVLLTRPAGRGGLLAPGATGAGPAAGVRTISSLAQLLDP